MAATRAQEHLILSGATDLERRNPPADLSEPMRWVWRGFCDGLPADGASGIHEDEFEEGRPLRVRWSRLTPETLDELLPAADRTPVAAASEIEPRHEQPALELGLPPAPRALPVSRLSYSGLEAYRRCGYRFYLQRSLGLAPVESPLPPDEAAAESGMTALLRGSIVHGLIERLDFAAPGRARPTRRSPPSSSATGSTPLPADVADLRAMVERVAGSQLRDRIAAARRVRTELPFTFTLTPPGAGGRSLLMNGVVDVYAVEERRHARGRLEERRPRRPRAGRCGGGGLRDAADRLRACGAAGGGGARRGGALLPRAPGRARRGRLRGGRRRRAWSASCSSWRAGSSRAASSRRTSRTPGCARTARAGRRSASTRRSSRCGRHKSATLTDRGPAHVNLGTRMARRDRAAFVGRAGELEAIAELFVDDPPASVVLVHGPGGIGKSALLRQVADRGREAGWSPVLVEGRELPPVPDAIEEALAAAHEHERPLILIDTYERMTALGGHLRRALLAVAA